MSASAVSSPAEIIPDKRTKSAVIINDKDARRESALEVGLFNFAPSLTTTPKNGAMLIKRIASKQPAQEWRKTGKLATLLSDV